MEHPYRCMTMADLETQYDARGTVSDFDAEMRAYRNLSNSAYSNLSVICDIAYGPGDDERIDFFPAKAPNSPLFVFIHGGYWRALGRSDSAFMAKSFVSMGVGVAVVEYSLAPAASLGQIVDQVRRAVSHLTQNTQRLSFDAARVYLGGSSAGAHLAAMALQPDTSELGSPVKGALLASGLYDLEPLRFCKPNDWLSLTKALARLNSPMQLPAPVDVPLVVVWGETETAEFKRQSQDFTAKVSQAGGSVIEFEVPNRNHFDVIADLADPETRLFRTAIDMINAPKKVVSPKP